MTAKKKKPAKKKATKKKAAAKKYTEKFIINASFEEVIALTFAQPKKK